MQRRAITVTGVVQGVGFRPFAFALASQFRLAGSVRNARGNVVIEIEGEPLRLDEFLAELLAAPPPLARIAQATTEVIPVLNETGFVIASSAAGDFNDIFLSPDIATCELCVRELFDPANRRFQFPFINCTNCGPRLTIITGSPYDRAQTTMASFPMCDACRHEYEDPGDRRFHAEPIACPECGPQLQLLDASGSRLAGNPLSGFASAFDRGEIGALKGLGGFHLVCDATNDAAVKRLRARKHREEKPFAVMVADVAAAKSYCALTSEEAHLLQSRAAPIVLVTKRIEISPAIAPGNSCSGLLLPYTPLHHLLMRASAGRPLVMTSGNRSDEPIATNDKEAREQLCGIADIFLTHDRPIHVRCDDSVTRLIAGEEAPLRRSRGYAPLPLELPFVSKVDVLAVGGQLKNTFAFGRGRSVFASHHLGDLDNRAAYLAFERDVALYKEIFHFEPAYVAHDLHPDYASTRYAQQSGLPLVGVQHHHAHMASCMAENRLTTPTIGVTFDGLGYGTDGAIWGGEFLVGDYANFRRAAHLRYVGMPGADQATHEPWRMALAHLLDAEVECPKFAARIPDADRRVVTQMIERRFNTPQTSSVGRLFDAVASLSGVRDRVSCEGQAAMELESLATNLTDETAYPISIDADSSGAFVVDTRPLIRAVASDVADGVSANCVAGRFHSTLAEIVAVVCLRIRDATGLRDVVLSGGVFLNALLTTQATTRLEAYGFTVYRHRLVPPNDGGLSLGQVAIAAARIRP